MAKKKTTRRRTKAQKKKSASRKTNRAPASKVGCEESQNRLDGILSGNPAAHFHKGLNHSDTGAVDPESFSTFVNAFKTLDADKNSQPLSSIGIGAGNRKWVNPLSGWAVDTEMSDPCYHTIPAPPALQSEEAAAEMVELYWMSNLRDLPFAYWSSDANVQQAAAELSEQTLFINRNGDVNQAPDESNGYVTRPVDAKSIFRGGELFTTDDVSDDNQPVRENAGPYISQFLAQDIPYGVYNLPQKGFWAQANTNYMTVADEFLAVQNGATRNPMENLVGVANEDADQRRHISTMRDLATYVHFDQLYQAYLDAALILVQNGYALDDGNPYGGNCPAYCGIGMSSDGSSGLGSNQEGFGIFGGAHILSLVTEVATRTLKSVWRQKWTHLRLRPEAYGGILALQPSTLGGAESTVMESEAFLKTKTRYSSGLLPMAFPEGSPMHPAYGAGHATVAGACVTVLKAFFKEDTPVRDLVVASSDGTSLLPYSESDSGQLTVGYELDKLAANISIGRNMAGVHWRSDYTQSILLGQRVATDMLYRQSRDYVEDYSFNFTSFGGGKVRICSDGVSFKEPGEQPTMKIVGGNDFGHPDRIARDNDKAIAQALLKIV